MPWMVHKIYKSRIDNLIAPYAPQGVTTEDQTLRKWEIAFVPVSGDPDYRDNFFKGYQEAIAFDSDSTELQDNDVEVYFRSTLRSALYTPDDYPAHPESNAFWDGKIAPFEAESWSALSSRVWEAHLEYELYVLNADKALDLVANPAFVVDGINYYLCPSPYASFKMWDIKNDAVPTLNEDFVLHYGANEDTTESKSFSLTDMDGEGIFTVGDLEIIPGDRYLKIQVDDNHRSGLSYWLPG